MLIRGRNRILNSYPFTKNRASKAIIIIYFFFLWIYMKGVEFGVSLSLVYLFKIDCCLRNLDAL